MIYHIYNALLEASSNPGVELEQTRGVSHDALPGLLPQDALHMSLELCETAIADLGSTKKVCFHETHCSVYAQVSALVPCVSGTSICEGFSHHSCMHACIPKRRPTWPMPCRELPSWKVPVVCGLSMQHYYRQQGSKTKQKKPYR